MPRFIAELSVGHSAVGSVADTMRALAPLEMAAWIAGICDAGVAAVPLVSVPFSPSALSAAMAPQELPRFFGMTKTFRPVFRLPPAAAELDPPEAAELDPPELDAGAVVEDEPL